MSAGGRHPGWIDCLNSHVPGHLLDIRTVPARMMGLQLADDGILVCISPRKEMLWGVCRPRYCLGTRGTHRDRVMRSFRFRTVSPLAEKAIGSKSYVRNDRSLAARKIR